MRKRHLGWIPVMVALSLSTATAAGRCKMVVTRPIPVTMRDMRPTLMTRINGVKARFLIDTGSFSNILTAASAAKYHLSVQNGPPDESLWDMTVMRSGGAMNGFAGGQDIAKFTTVKSFTYMGVRFTDIPFRIIPDTDLGLRGVGVLGNNLLSATDVEFDFPKGVMRLVRAVGCANQPLAYWAKNQPVAVVDLLPLSNENPAITGRGKVDGHSILITFDTGSPTSTLSLSAAGRADITPTSPGVVADGTTSGVGGGTVKVWIAPVASLQIGTEKIEHTHIRIARFILQNVSEAQGRTDMLVGEDFFLSHRILVSYHRRKMYFTYSGGPVFDLGKPASDWKHAQAGAAAATASQAARSDTNPASDTPVTADGYMREGMAYAAQQEYGHALAALDHACQLAPKDAQYRYQRGMLYWRDKQPAKALTDFDTAIKLRPADLRAHMARADLRLSTEKGLKAGAHSATASDTNADLNTVDHLAPQAAGLRLQLSSLFEDAGEYPQAIRQVTMWIRHHGQDGNLPTALNDRCWYRAEADRELRQALDDCDRALDLTPDDPAILDSRALVYLRLGRLDDAVSGYDAALRRDPKQASSLYGRGLAELREGKKAKGRADLAVAKKLDAGVAKSFARIGLKP